MAEAVNTTEATGGVSVTSQVAGGTRSNAAAKTAPGTVPVGPDYPEPSPSLHNDPQVQPLHFAASNRVDGGEPAEGARFAGTEHDWPGAP